MYDNRSWLWQYQDCPVMTALYNGLFNIVSSVSSVNFSDLYIPDNLSGNNLLYLAKLLNIEAVGGEYVNAMTWDIDKWNDEEKFWNGELDLLNDEIFRRYILMKTHQVGKPFSITTIKTLLDAFVNADYSCEIVEDDYSFEIIITTIDLSFITAVNTILTIDKHIFGKPTGIAYTVTLKQG